MNAKDKELAVKIFDHFILSKHKIFYWEIYPRYVVDSFDYHFNIDCCICCTQINGAITAECNILMFGNKRGAASFTIENHMPMYEAQKYSFPDIPDNIKVAIIEECLKRNEVLYASSINDNLNIMLMPAAKSLEELAIMMELER